MGACKLHEDIKIDRFIILRKNRFSSKLKRFFNFQGAKNRFSISKCNNPNSNSLSLHEIEIKNENYYFVFDIVSFHILWANQCAVA
jgi:hypothetical protein